ncbi:hypothetical protein SISNIDRAFT_550821 [Sistotremastrum niveocremeum HHB9708]|uniref:Uncharacterized protein n=1 Tax=Sistotremastrum niveocremeum HHB9708 TaxID=1314777 RepID=A0A164SSY8_9AGAM|nr:hypothetical protein SISNIDRAFT_550821 [Sistotremastrum niveocremeum HHB9708]
MDEDDSGASSASVSAICADFEEKIAKIIEHQACHVDELESGDALVKIHETFREVESKVAASLQTMKWQLNRKAPIERLAPELILEILRYYKLHESSYVPAAYSTSTRWRNVAVGSPELWTKVSLPIHPKLFALIKERSGTRPMFVYIPNCDGCDARCLDEKIGEPLGQLASRIFRLDIFWSRERSSIQSINNFLRTHIRRREFAILESFQLSEYSELEQEPMAILDMPALRELVLEGEITTKPFIRTTALASLDVSWTGMTSSDLRLLLAEFPHLEECSIENERSGFDIGTRPAGFSPSLDNLRSLSVRSLCVSEMSHFLDHIVIPFSADIVVEVERDRSPGAVALSFADFLGPRIAPYNNELRIDDIHYGPSYTLTSKSGTSLCGINRTRDDLDSLLSVAPYNNSLTVLDLNVKALPPLSRLIDALRSWSLITHIGVHTQKADFERLLDALQFEDPETSILCPRLDSLDCSETEFSCSRLQRFLEFRKSKGLWIRKLKTTQGFSDSTVEALTSLIDEHQQVAPERSLIKYC